MYIQFTNNILKDSKSKFKQKQILSSKPVFLQLSKSLKSNMYILRDILTNNLYILNTISWLYHIFVYILVTS